MRYGSRKHIVEKLSHLSSIDLSFSRPPSLSLSLPHSLPPSLCPSLPLLSCSAQTGRIASLAAALSLRGGRLTSAVSMAVTMFGSLTSQSARVLRRTLNGSYRQSVYHNPTRDSCCCSVPLTPPPLPHSDYGYMRSDGLSGPCVRDPTIILPSHCGDSSETTYQQTRGYVIDCLPNYWSLFACPC